MKIYNFLFFTIFYFNSVTVGFEFNSNTSAGIVDTNVPQSYLLRIKRRGGFGGGGRGISIGRAASVGRSGWGGSSSGGGGARSGGGFIFFGSGGHGSGKSMDGSNSTDYKNKHDENDDVAIAIFCIAFIILFIIACCIECFEKQCKLPPNDSNKFQLNEMVVPPQPRYYSNGSNQALKYTSTQLPVNKPLPYIKPPLYKKQHVVK